MASGEKIKIDFIGAGQVVQRFLEKKNSSINTRVYDRRSQKTSDQFVRPIQTFEPSDSILILCASTDEESILRKTSSQARLTVAQENLVIIDDLIRNGTFKNQIVFVLTNPSEIIAEFIYRNSENKRVYALVA
jgi:hypothetical protein